jgi:hypothetical protein
MAFRIVRDAEALAAGMDRRVESVFRNVDAHVLCYRLISSFLSPRLVSGA